MIHKCSKKSIRVIDFSCIPNLYVVSLRQIIFHTTYLNSGRRPSENCSQGVLYPHGRGLGSFFLILLCMSNKTYSLVAWTEGSEVRMIPSLINECSLPYRERIARLEDRRSAFRNTADWLLERSRAHEPLARFSSGWDAPGKPTRSTRTPPSPTSSPGSSRCTRRSLAVKFGYPNAITPCLEASRRSRRMQPVP